MSFLKKIQDQPKHIRKIIFWVIIIFLGIIFFFTWFYSLKGRLEEAKKREIFEQLKPPKFEEQLKTIPKIETPKLPELSEEELKKLEEELKKYEE